MLGITFITLVKWYSLSYITNLAIGTNRCLLLSITEHDTNLLLHSLGRYSGSDGKESTYNAGEQVRSLGQEDLGRRKWQPTPVFLPGESQGRWSLVGRYLWGHTESDTTEAT